MGVTFSLEGLNETVRNLSELPKATRRNVLRRLEMQALQPFALTAQALAPRGETGRLVGAITVTTRLTRRHRRGAKVNEVETYAGPTSTGGVLFYATFQEFGSIMNPAHPFMRPAWDSKKGITLEIMRLGLRREVMAAAGRLARKAARLAA